MRIVQPQLYYAIIPKWLMDRFPDEFRYWRRQRGRVPFLNYNKSQVRDYVCSLFGVRRLPRGIVIRRAR